MNLGNKILKIRKDNKMSQEDLAEVLNVTRQTVSNWENGKNYPDITTLVLISDKFNISLDILLKGEQRMIKEIDKKVKMSKKLKIIIGILVIIIVIGLPLSNWITEQIKIYSINNTIQESAMIAKCNYNGERLKLSVGYMPYNLDKKWNEPYIYDATKVEPISYSVSNNATRERKEDIIKDMNFNISDYDKVYDLLHAMEDYIISHGGTCDNRK